MTQNHSSSLRKAQVMGGVAVAAVLGLGVVMLLGKRSAVVDPLVREPGKAAALAASAKATTTKAQDSSNQRWRQRAEERQVNQGAAGDDPATFAGRNDPNNPTFVPHNGVGAPGGVQRDGSTVGAGQGQGQSANNAALPNGQNTGDSLVGGPFVNAKLAVNGTSAENANANGASKPGSTTRSTGATTTSGLGGGAKAPPVVAGCGDGVMQAGELCEPASSPKCGDDCTPVISDACYDCEVNSVCVALASSCTDYPSSKTDQSLCYDVEHCIQDTGCAAGDKTLTSCFCGELGMEQCRSAPSAGDLAPHGACADVIRNAMGQGVSNTFVLTHYTTTSTPAGAAIKRFQCLKANPVCAPTCFRK